MIAVVGVVENKGRILVGRKVISKAHFLSGAWHIPGGKVRAGESDEEALKREIKEECGIDIKVEKFLDEFYEPVAKMRSRWYLCSSGNSELKPGSDVTDVKWVDKKEVMKTCDKEAVARWPDKIREFLRPKLLDYLR
ncbi:MAG: NUDIX hydrolase [Candidatus Aenigmarchaeota archaeon]|nr:NUDIX hydrolase [Candidatus Aenigmarchaeota archaeon]